MTAMGPLELALLAAAGVLAGVVNTLAGGGSLIALPALILLGLPPGVANGTNRVGVLLQSLVASTEFKREGVLELSTAARLVPVTALGAALGAWGSTHLEDEPFQQLIAVAMLLMLGVVLLRPRRWLEGEAVLKLPVWARALVFFGIGLYGGFLQAGVGVFLLGGLVLVEGLDLVRANAVKVLLVFAFTLIPLALFVGQGLVAWGPGLALASGSMLGGWLGARLTVSWGPRFVRWVLVTVVLASTGRLLGMW